MVETALTMSIVLLLLTGLLTFALSGFAASAAQSAARHGARMGALAQENQAQVAYAAANEMLSKIRVGRYTVMVSGGGEVGSVIAVEVQWEVPNFFGPLGALFPGLFSQPIRGTSVAYFRQEGW
ncbi:MAG: TadE/TadG family type IV pilus assembly protein [Candidatus Hadarchaeales archaeon]